MERGYDDNKMFFKLDELKQDNVIRLTSKRKLFFHNKWIPATELRNRRKGKIITNVFYRGRPRSLSFLCQGTNYCTRKRYLTSLLSMCMTSSAGTCFLIV